MEWIPVKDRLPNENEWVLIIDLEGDLLGIYQYNNGKFVYSECCRDYEKDPKEIKYWMSENSIMPK